MNETKQIEKRKSLLEAKESSNTSLQTEDITERNSIIKSPQLKSTAVDDIFLRHCMSTKVEHVKEGFWVFKNINPIARYNFYIERYNDLLKFDEDQLLTIPINSIVSKIYDTYICFCRITFAVFLILESEMARMFRWDNYSTVYKYYSWSESSPKKFKTILLILASIILLLITLWLILNYALIVVIPQVFFFGYVMFSVYIFYRNRKILKDDFYANMIYDPEIDKSDKLNNYIIVNPGTVESYVGNGFYSGLFYLYRKRDQTVSQQFMLYGSHFKNENWNLILSFMMQFIILFVSLIFMV